MIQASGRMRNGPGVVMTGGAGVRGSRVWALAMGLVMAGCIDAVHERPPLHPAARAASPPAAEEYREPQAASVALTLQGHGSLGDHHAYRFTMPSSGASGQPGNVIRGWYFTRGQASAPLVLIVPICGSSAYPSWTMARFLIDAPATREVSVLLVEAEADLMDLRATLMARLAWSVETFRRKLQPLADPINPALMPSVNGDRLTLYVEASDDDCIPKSARDALRDTLNPVEEIRLGYRHWPAFLVGMTPFGLHYLERAVVRFFADAFYGPGS